MADATAPGPFERLQAIDRRCQALLGTADPAGATREEWTGVLFSLAGQRLLVDMARLSEIIPLPAVTRVPLLKPWVLGVANLHNSLLTVIDLRAFWFRSATPRSGRERVLVVNRQEERIGLLVQEVQGMRHFWTSERSDELPPLAEAVRAHVRGAFRRQDDHFAVFDVDRLLDDPAFSQVAL